MLKEDIDSKALFNEVVEKIAKITLSENEAESETELDNDEDLESFLKEFVQMVTGLLQNDNGPRTLGLYSHFPIAA